MRLRPAVRGTDRPRARDLAALLVDRVDLLDA